MDLIDDKHAVTARLRRDAHLVGQVTDIVDTVIGGAVKLVDVVGTLLVKRLARCALVTGFTIRSGMFTVDGFGKNAGTGGLSNSSGAAEKIGVCQFPAFHGVLQRGG